MPAPSEKPALLLVEDDENDAFFFNRRFQQSGLHFQVHRAMDGRAAIEFLRSGLSSGSLPQAIFLDLKMPILSGFDVLAWMQKQTFPVPVPVIVLSGSEEEQDKDRARRLGAADYIVKPLKVDDLHRFLRDAPVSKRQRTGAKF